MKYYWAKNLYDRDGDISEQCLLVFAGETVILKFQDSVELEQFAHSILDSLKEISENS